MVIGCGSGHALLPMPSRSGVRHDRVCHPPAARSHDSLDADLDRALGTHNGISPHAVLSGASAAGDGKDVPIDIDQIIYLK